MNNNFNELIDSLREVYVKHENKTIEVNPEYIYMTIPADYICIYNKILLLLSRYGIEMLNDCQAGCTNKNKSIINCFNMFNAAVAAKKLGLNKEAETIIKYVSGQLKIINSGEINIPNIVFPIDEKGQLKAMVTCEENPKFTIDVESGLLWKETIKSNNNGKVYSINDNELTTIK